MANADFSHQTTTEVTRVKYDQLHRFILFFRYTALTALWATFCIFFVRVVFLGVPEDQGGLSLEYTVICSSILFLSAIFSHHILEWDHLITSLRYPTGRWRCHCSRCLARRRHGNISKLTPRGLHGILANRHTWTFLPAGTTFFLMLLLTDASWAFLIVLVFWFEVGEIAFFRISRSAVAACRASLNEPLQLPSTLKPFTADSPAFYHQASPLPFRAIVAGAGENESAESDNERGDVRFSMQRTVSPDDNRQRIDGWLKMTFRPDQMQVTQHVPFTPAFDNVPQVTLEPESEIDVVVDEPVVMPHGMRFDIKRRTHDEEADNTVVVHFAVESSKE